VLKFAYAVLTVHKLGAASPQMIHVTMPSVAALPELSSGMLAAPLVALARAMRVSRLARFRPQEHS